jgi:uncharacterized protein
VQEIADRTNPKNNKFLSLTSAGKAEMIVVSDLHLTQMHPWRSIHILARVAFFVVA